MSGIVLSSSVRQNLLSLQSTADLLSTTQNHLATGKKVNTALDNPTNYFTAASLDNRASDINNLLDGIGNGVQILQAANTGITSLQKLVDTAKSIANQALQTPVGYSTKANVDVTGTGAGVGTTTAADAQRRQARRFGHHLQNGDWHARSDDRFDVRNRLGHGNGQDARPTEQRSGVQWRRGVRFDFFDRPRSLTFTSTNDAASQTITSTGTAPTGEGVDIQAATATVGTVNAAVADATSQTTRANLVTQYNEIIQQITTTAQDASFNGINLLNGDNLKLMFNETGKSTLNISGVTFNSTGLGLSRADRRHGLPRQHGDQLRYLQAQCSASSMLRSEASTLGSNLSVVQIRQDFSKNLINVLQTGSSNLTLADTNEEAANSQALSTRQSIAVSALALANQASRACSSCSADLAKHRNRKRRGKPRRFRFDWPDAIGRMSARVRKR